MGTTTEAEQAAQDVVAPLIESFLTGGMDGVRRTLSGLGWIPGLGIEGTVIDTVWAPAVRDGRARAQTGERGDDCYVGLIANVSGDQMALGLRDRMVDRIAEPLSEAGFGHGSVDDLSVSWAREQVVVEISVLPEVRHDTHTLPAAVQFAIQPRRTSAPASG